MVGIPTIYGDDWGMVCYCYTHITHMLHGAVMLFTTFALKWKVCLIMEHLANVGKYTICGAYGLEITVYDMGKTGIKPIHGILEIFSAMFGHSTLWSLWSLHIARENHLF